MRILRGAILAGLLVLTSSVTAAPPIRVAVTGTAFRVTPPDGVTLSQQQLPGVILTLGDGAGGHRRFRIDSAEPDPRDPKGEVMLYGLSEQDPVTHAWVNACQPDPDGRRLGFPLPGAFTTRGDYQPGHPGILITCTSGAEGKCIRFGYKPWENAPDGTSLAPFYQACIRMVRADYCGDGVAFTKNGMHIDLFDRIGIQRDEPADGMSFEAAFGPDGAVCVAHPRVRQRTTLDRLRELCPAHVAPTCDESAPGLLFVRSYDK